MNRVRTKQIIREQKAVINTDVLGLALRVSVCRTVVHPTHTNTVTLSSWLKITTAETIGTQNTHQHTHVPMQGDTHHKPKAIRAP